MHDFSTAPKMEETSYNNQPYLHVSSMQQSPMFPQSTTGWVEMNNNFKQGEHTISYYFSTRYGFVPRDAVKRIEAGMRLQVDATVCYATGRKSSQLTKEELAIDSPYNTYKYKGLPPGPICMPSIAAINAVLDYEKHEYIYFCAKEDFSGYHNFAACYAQHLANARRYQNALNRNNIN